MSGRLLIEEPPLLLSRTLAGRLGLEAALVVQQLHYHGRGRPDGWVDRGVESWLTHDFPFMSARTLERAFAKLVKLGVIETKRGGRGEPARRRVVDHELLQIRQVGTADPPSWRDSGSKARGKTETPPVSPADEDAFSTWQEAHCAISGEKHAKLGTKARGNLVASVAARLAEGYTLDELVLASQGAWSDEYRRERGYTSMESVLRPSKIRGLIERGRRVPVQDVERRSEREAQMDAWEAENDRLVNEREGGTDV